MLMLVVAMERAGLSNMRLPAGLSMPRPAGRPESELLSIYRQLFIRLVERQCQVARRSPTSPTFFDKIPSGPSAGRDRFFLDCHSLALTYVIPSGVELSPSGRARTHTARFFDRLRMTKMQACENGVD
jgi:hypothetical protein